MSHASETIPSLETILGTQTGRAMLPTLLRAAHRVADRKAVRRGLAIERIFINPIEASGARLTIEVTYHFRVGAGRRRLRVLVWRDTRFSDRTSIRIVRKRAQRAPVRTGPARLVA